MSYQIDNGCKEREMAIKKKERKRSARFDFFILVRIVSIFGVGSY